MIDMTRGDVGKLIRNLAIPTSIGFFFNTMYNVVDTFYSGLISTDALAALGASFPIFFVIIALGAGISTGATALISNALGERKKKLVQTYTAQSITYTVLVGIALTMIGLNVSPYLFKMMITGTGATLAVEYMGIILLGTIPFILTFTFNAILTSSGDTRSFRNVLIAGFIMNLILNPALIYGWVTPALGFKGIAWATTIIWIIGAVYMGFKVSRLNIICKGCNRLFIPQKEAFRNITSQGFPASLNMLTVALGIFIITFFIAKFGNAAVAAYGIATRIEQIALLPLSGLSTAILAMVGQNNGARKPERVTLTLRNGLRYGIFVTAFSTLTMFIFAFPLMGLFTSDASVISIGGTYLKIAAFIGWAYIILYLNVAALQGLKRPMFALWIGLYRQIAAPIIVFLIVTTIGFGLVGIWWSILAVTWSAAIITIIYARKHIGDLW